MLLIGSLMVGGAIALSGAMFDWGWLVDNAATHRVVERFGRVGGRLACLALGVVMITTGGAILSVGPLPA